MLPQNLAKCFTSVIHSFIIQEVQLLQDIDQVYLLVFREVLFHDLTILFIKLLYFSGLIFLLLKRW